MAEHIELQEVGLHGVIFEVSDDDIGTAVVRRVLDRAEVVDLLVLGDDHHAAGMLAGRALDPGTAQRQTVFFRLGRM
ncbi:hypothetical protein SDC9_55623 [bioreactor metagenome]|uniref:Uncharacterized protein n=1 Tax=bioreactor metagenome TaxID=1076179 RepID=A0A644X029_9ZZZZ